MRGGTVLDREETVFSLAVIYPRKGGPPVLGGMTAKSVQFLTMRVCSTPTTQPQVDQGSGCNQQMKEGVVVSCWECQL